MPEEPTIARQGSRYVLGLTGDSYGIWKLKDPSTPVEKYPVGEDGWRRAVESFEALEASDEQPSSVPAVQARGRGNAQLGEAEIDRLRFEREAAERLVAEAEEEANRLNAAADEARRRVETARMAVEHIDLETVPGDVPSPDMVTRPTPPPPLPVATTNQDTPWAAPRAEGLPIRATMVLATALALTACFVPMVNGQSILDFFESARPLVVEPFLFAFTAGALALAMKPARDRGFGIAMCVTGAWGGMFYLSWYLGIHEFSSSYGLAPLVGIGAGFLLVIAGLMLVASRDALTLKSATAPPRVAAAVGAVAVGMVGSAFILAPTSEVPVTFVDCFTHCGWIGAEVALLAAAGAVGAVIAWKATIPSTFVYVVCAVWAVSFIIGVPFLFGGEGEHLGPGGYAVVTAGLLFVVAAVFARRATTQAADSS